MSSVEARPAGWNATRVGIAAALVAAMCAFGFGVYHAAALLKGATKTQVQRPTETRAAVLPGTMYVEQAGAIYRFNQGSFVRITPEDGWTQPAISPDGNWIVAVKRSLDRSDLYLLRPNGRVVAQLTHNQSRDIGRNHWAFYPRFGPDSSTLYFSYDPKDPNNSYRVDLAIFATNTAPPSSPAVQWTVPNEYTGGDVDPVPLRDGGLIYTKFSIDDNSNVHSQVWLQARRGTPGVGLTKAADDCSQPAVSKDETLLAMVCRHGGLQSADLEVASLDVAGRAIGAPATYVKEKLVGSPSFSPDGTLIAFMAPGDRGGPFQLWTVAPNSAQTPPSQITKNLDLDPTSTPNWTT